jgi:hypothetical protein
MSAVVATGSRGGVTVTLEAPDRTLARGQALELRLLLSMEADVEIAPVVTRDPVWRPTSIQIGAAEGLTPGELTAPETSVDPLGGDRLSAYAGTVLVRVPVTAAPECLLGPAPIAVRVLYQARREGKLMPPDQLEVHGAVDIITC